MLSALKRDNTDEVIEGWRKVHTEVFIMRKLYQILLGFSKVKC